MTIKERLIMEIRDLSESEAALVLEFLEMQKQPPSASPWPPAFAGIGRSGQHDLAARSEEILRAQFGKE